MRSGISDTRLGPFENLATNPTFARAVAGSTVVRRNECRDPRVASSAVWNPTTSSSRGMTPAGKTALVLNRVGGMAAVATYYVAARLPITPGEALAVSVEGIVGPGMRMSSDVQFFREDGSTALITSRHNLASPTWTGTPSNTVIAQDGVPTRFGRLHVAPADAVRYALRIFTDNGADGFCYATDVLVEKLPSLLPFFYAGMQDNSGIVYEHEGTANASSTVAKAAVVEVRKQLLSVPRGNTLLGWQSDGGATLTPVVGGVQVDIAPGTTQNNGRVWRTATPPSPTSPCSVAVVVTVPAGYPPVTVYLQRRLNYVGPPAGNDQLNSANTTVQPGTSVRLVVESSATRSDTSAFTFLIGNIGQQSQALRYVFSEPQLEAAPVAGPYFDGGTTPDANLMPAWTGEENASSSVLYGVRALDASANVPMAVYRTWDGRAAVIPNGGYFQLASYTPQLGSTWTHRALVTTGVTTNVTLYAILNTSGGTLVRNLASKTIPTGTTQELRGSYSVPTDVTLSSVRFWIGFGAQGATHYVSQAMIVPGFYAGPFPDADRLNWRGQVNGSAQVFYPRLVA